MDNYHFNKMNSPESNKCHTFKLINSSNKNNSANSKEYSPFVIKNNNYSSASNSKKNTLTERKTKKINKSIYSPSQNCSKTDKSSDRFIPLNKGINLMEKFNLAKRFDELSDENINSSNVDNNEYTYNDKFSRILEKNALNENIGKSIFTQNISDENKIINNNIFSFKTDSKPKINFFDLIKKNNDIDITYTNTKKINPKPYKTIYAPNLMNDFYLNLLDWSSNNDIAVGLRNIVGIWTSNQTKEYVLSAYDNPQNYVSSLIWSPTGQYLAVGNNFGQVEIYDGILN